MTGYTATARREGDWWVIDVDGVGVTQCRELWEADHAARDLVAQVLDVPAAGVWLSVEVAS